MKGDFSKWKKFDGKENFSGVLHQQGRVLLDEDWNAQTRIINYWQDTAAKDTIGPGVAAVPADDHDAFRVNDATVDEGGTIKVTLSPGRVWADGLLVHLDSELELVAQPIQVSSVTPAEAGARDAVILEVWREDVNGFQDQDALIEPALGGPDTTERVHTAMALRLLRLDTGEACENIRRRLSGDARNKPRLRATLHSADVSNGDCPKVSGGGYTGFEHHLYRIEIAETHRPEPMFKWSQFNGALVGRGTFKIEGGETIIDILANTQAITTSGIVDFYLEIVEKGPELRHWHVSYGAKVVLSEERLTIQGPPYLDKGTLFPGKDVFFRLWNDIEEVSRYVVSITGPLELHNGIVIEFHPPPSEDGYSPGDYWTFPVRAGLDNSRPLLDRQPPEGIEYHRVPLAELLWDNDGEKSIKDCRRIFPPMTRKKACCTFTVGDGIRSHGDYDSIQQAIEDMPDEGGEIHLLPGIHWACAEIRNKFNITIKGCDLRTFVWPDNVDTSYPLFKISNSYYIKLEHLFLANAGRTAVEVDQGYWIELAHNVIVSLKHALRVNQGRIFNIHDNTIRMWDREGGDVAIYFAADDGLIERNSIAVVPAGRQFVDPGTEEPPPDPNEPCDSPEEVEGDPRFKAILLDTAKASLSDLSTVNPYRALGGIQIAGGSERVIVSDNWIHGGDGNGITLGTGYVVPRLAEPEEDEPTAAEKMFHIEGTMLAGKVTENGMGLRGLTIHIRSATTAKLWPTTTYENGEFRVGNTSTGRDSLSPGKYFMSIETTGYAIEEIIPLGEESLRSLFNVQKIEVKVRKEALEQDEPLGFLYDIAILNNRITRMGLCGIGAAAGLSHIGVKGQGYSRRLGNPVISLEIAGNRIRNCMQNPQSAFDAIGAIRGLGGISLGMCERLTIRGNRIEDNGRDHRDPVCGIFAVYAALVDISDNYIANNGPLSTKADRNIRPGIRGGIVLPRVFSLTLEGLQQTTRSAAPPADGESMPLGLINAIHFAGAMGGYAVRIHENLIRQPIKHALNICALGPVSVADNQLVADFPEREDVRLLAGTVFIKNFGQPHYIRKFLKHPMPSGSILFSNNHIRLGFANAWTSVTILSADDIAFSNNHSDIMEGAPVLVNTLLSAVTQRAIGNRLQENVISSPSKSSIYSIISNINKDPIMFSLLTYGYIMNNTSGNQTNHSVVNVCSSKRVVGDSTNQSIVPPNTWPITDDAKIEAKEVIEDLLLEHTSPFFYYLKQSI